MANYTQVTETLWVVEPQNLKEAIYLRYLQLRKKVGTLNVVSGNGTKRIWIISAKNADEFKRTLKLRRVTDAN